MVNCWSRVLRHSRWWRCLQRESEYISTTDVAHALEIRSALVECDMTLRIKGKNGRDSWACNGRETWSRPRAPLGCAIVVAAAVVRRRRGSLVSAFEPAWRTQRGRPGVEDDRFNFAFERNTPSTTNEFIELLLTDGGSEFLRGCGSKRLSCVNLEREEHMRDGWLVPDLCGNGHRDPDGVVRRAILGFLHFR